MFTYALKKAENYFQHFYDLILVFIKKVLFMVLFVAVIVRCQDILEEDAALSSDIEERTAKEKRGIALNLGGTGLEGYSYFGPTSRGLGGGYGGRYSYAPMADYGN